MTSIQTQGLTSEARASGLSDITPGNNWSMQDGKQVCR